MAVIVKMPKIGLNMTDGLVERFLVQEGDTVVKDQPIVEIETDKSCAEIEAPQDGVVLKILCSEGDMLPITDPILVIGAPNETYLEEAQPDGADAVPAPAESAAPAPAAAAPRDHNDRLFASPMARRLACERGIDLAQVQGSGPNGRVVKKDLEAYHAPAPAMSAPVYAQPAPWDLPLAERIPMTGMHKAVAANMCRSKAVIPEFQLNIRIDMTEVLALRKQINAAQSEANVSLNDFLIKAASIALKQHPIINSAMGYQEILLFGPANIGLAVALPQGLIVPVIHNTQDKSLLQIASESRKLIESARNGKLPPANSTGGTFTISNLGMYGIDHFTAIINLPESSILAVGAITKQAVVDPQTDAITVRPMMNATGTFDHRMINGADAAAFLQTFRSLLEQPLKLIL